MSKGKTVSVEELTESRAELERDFIERSLRLSDIFESVPARPVDHWPKIQIEINMAMSFCHKAYWQWCCRDADVVKAGGESRSDYVKNLLLVRRHSAGQGLSKHG